jgi:hypothetical protein
MNHRSNEASLAFVWLHMWKFTWKHKTFKIVWWSTLILEGETAVSRNLHLLVDAEQSYINPGSSLVALAMMAVFNQDRPVVANTYQCYFKVTSLLLWLTFSQYLYLYFPLLIHWTSNLKHIISVYKRCQISLVFWTVFKRFTGVDNHMKRQTLFEVVCVYVCIYRDSNICQVLLTKLKRSLHSQAKRHWTQKLSNISPVELIHCQIIWKHCTN